MSHRRRNEWIAFLAIVGVPVLISLGLAVTGASAMDWYAAPVLAFAVYALLLVALFIGVTVRDFRRLYCQRPHGNQ